MAVTIAGNILVQSNGEPIPISMGGTGQSTAPTAINALLPVQTTNGTNVSWSSSAAGSPGGADTNIQFNDSGTFGGSANFVINKSTGALTSVSTLTNTGLVISDSVVQRLVKYQTSGLDRWTIGADATAEGGASTGSNFSLTRIADNGSTSNQVLTISRATGIVDFKATPTINGSAINSASALSGTTLASGITDSSLTSVGTLTSLAVAGALTINTYGIGATQVGYLNMPQRAVGSTTLIMADSGMHIFNTTASQVYTIPSNASVAFPIGTAITFVNQGAGTCTININSDTLYLAGAAAGTPGTRTLAAYGLATALKITSTSWIMSGAGLS
jgi:hypothetical protein